MIFWEGGRDISMSPIKKNTKNVSVAETEDKRNKPQIFNPDGISPAVIRRMPRYLRYVRTLKQEGVSRISSEKLSKLMNVSASQIRQDFNCFGGFGQQGYGYNVDFLYSKMEEILCLGKGYRAIILGAGNLGRALIHSPMFSKAGVRPVAMFDVRENLVGDVVGGVPIYHIDNLEDFCEKNKVDIAVLTLSREAAPEVANRAINCGIVAIWNFTNAKLGISRNEAIVESVHMSDSLMTLTYRLGYHEKSRKEAGSKAAKMSSDDVGGEK